ncbi:hypothetical protein [Vibrio sp. TRT 29B02]|uniref:hypothetical protein n=1 Tax=Vibrio sp. TRT 29B02 TaxID=3418508 RepID=UPI003CEEDB7B
MLRNICITASLVALSISAVHADDKLHSIDNDNIVVAERSTSVPPVESLSIQLAEVLGRPVLVQQVSGSDLFSVAYDDKVYFTDTSGSVLINGDVITLADNVLVSDIIKHEIRVLYEKQQKIKNSQLSSLDSFLSTSNKKPSPNLSSSQSQLGMGSQSLGESIAESKTSATTSIDEKNVILPQASMSSADLTASIAISKKQRQQLEGERQCLEKMTKANDLKELYQTFYYMDKEERITCGKAYAAAKVPFTDDAQYIVYKAENEKDVITMFSDYTCSICVKDHKNIQELNARGVTVRVAPFGRGEYKNVVKAASGDYTYGEGYSILGKNYNALACGTDDPIERKAMFGELMENPYKYTNSILPQAETTSTDGVCTANLMREKIVMDLYTTRGTPFYVFSDGSTVRGGMGVNQIVSRLPAN